MENKMGWFTFKDGYRGFFNTFRDGRMDVALAIMEHGEIVKFEER